jgi:tyrosine-protein kinase Etk/Wzc
MAALKTCGTGTREKVSTVAPRCLDALRSCEAMDTLERAEQEELKGNIEQSGFDLFDLLLILSEARRTIAFSTLICMALGIVVSLLLRPTFSASALILPPQQSQSLSSMMGQLMGQLSALAPVASLASGGQVKTPADMYIGILESRTIADHLIAKFHLQQLYKTKKMEDARTSLKNNTRFLAGKDGLIHITVDDHDPNRASEMANAFVDELYDMNSHLAITEAAQRRVFFDQELADEKTALVAAENDLKQTSEKTGVIQLGGQAAALIHSVATLRAQIASREVEMSAMRTFATDQNPKTIMIQEEINSMRDQLAKLERDPRNPELSSVGIPAGQVPAITLEYARKLREVKYHETLFELLARQYEAARIDEAKAAPIIQVVDRAVAPDKKSGPHRLLITLGCGFIGFCIGYLFAFAMQALRRAAQVPEYAIKLARIRSGFRFSL